MRLISAMTSKTSESELLEQVLSSSDSHSDSLELPNRGEGETRREVEEIHQMVTTLGDSPMTQTSPCKDSCLSSRQIFECQALWLSNTMKSQTARNAKSQSSWESKQRFFRERRGAGENASHSSSGLQILKEAAIQTRASPRWKGHWWFLEQVHTTQAGRWSGWLRRREEEERNRWSTACKSMQARAQGHRLQQQPRRNILGGEG